MMMPGLPLLATVCLVLATGAVSVLLVRRTGPAIPLLLWLVVGLLLVVADLGRFDGLRHVGDVIDATTLVWARAVVIRGIAGAFALMLAVPAGIGTARWLAGDARVVAKGRAAAGGLAVLGTPGAALLASSMLLAPVARWRTSPEAATSTVARYAAAVTASDRALLVGGVIAVLAGAAVALALLRSERTASRR